MIKVTTVDGREVEITMDEGKRIASVVFPHNNGLDNFHRRVKDRNEHYLKNANNNVRTIAERNGFSDFHGNEEELKELLSRMLGASPDIGDLIVEIAEQRIAHHHEEIYTE
jgi:hypothetical protein